MAIFGDSRVSKSIKEITADLHGMQTYICHTTPKHAYLPHAVLGNCEWVSKYRLGRFHWFNKSLVPAA